jgi:exopolysaccharide biosynthesis protein
MATTTPAKTAAETPSPKITATPTPAPTPEPTPTPDPWADFFSPKEQVDVVDGKSWTYKGPDLAVFIQKVYYEDCKSVFFIAHIYSRNPSNIGCAMEDTKRGRIAVYPQSLARKFKAVYAQNGNYFADPVNKNRGPDVRNGIVYKAKIGADFMLFQPDGEMQVWDTKRNPVVLDDLLIDSITQIYGFGPILVENGKVRAGLSKHVLFPLNPRNAFGTVEPGHYVGILVDGRKPGVSKGVNLQRLAEEFVTQGCVSAYNLDGGQSTAMVFMGNQLNDHKNESAFSGQRRIPDMLTFGTSEQVPAK